MVEVVFQRYSRLWQVCRKDEVGAPTEEALMLKTVIDIKKPQPQGIYFFKSSGANNLKIRLRFWGCLFKPNTSDKVSFFPIIDSASLPKSSSNLS